MRFVIQRVTSARVDIDGQTKASIEKGFAVLIGIGKGDDASLKGQRNFTDISSKSVLTLSEKSERANSERT